MALTSARLFSRMQRGEDLESIGYRTNVGRVTGCDPCRLCREPSCCDYLGLPCTGEVTQPCSIPFDPSLSTTIAHKREPGSLESRDGFWPNALSAPASVNESVRLLTVRKAVLLTNLVMARKQRRVLPGCSPVAKLAGIEVGVVSGVIKTSNHPALKRR